MAWDAERVTYCATCRMACEEGTDSLRPGIKVHFHNSAVLRHHAEMGVASHEPIPVPIEELDDPIRLCDFDSAVPATYLYVSADVYKTTKRQVVAEHVKLSDYRQQHVAARVHRVDTGARYTTNWGTRWAACEGCATLIEVRDVLGLVRRVIDGMPPRLTAGRKLIRVRAVLITDFEDLFATLEPQRLRIEPGHPYGVLDVVPPHG